MLTRVFTCRLPVIFAEGHHELSDMQMAGWDVTHGKSLLYVVIQMYSPVMLSRFSGKDLLTSTLLPFSRKIIWSE